ncbi:MAG: putative cation diffusion facilitator family transporter, partial [Leptospirillum sp. Group IV 'UBA BS']
MCLSRHHHHHHHHPHSDDFFRGPEGSLRPASPDNPLLWPVLGSSTLLFLFSLPEILSGEMSRSRGLVADGLHNLLDWAGTLPLLFGLWAERRAPSPRFPYGLGKAETLSGLGVLLMVLASAFMTLYLSVRGLFSPSPVREPLLAMGIALASV